MRDERFLITSIIDRHVGRSGARRVRSRTLVTLSAVILIVVATETEAQATKATATRAPAAKAPATRASAPVGTLGADAAKALGDPWKSAAGSDSREAGTPRSGRRIHGSIIPLRVIDAPLVSRGGGALVVREPDEGNAPVAPAVQWYPTMRPPRWQIVDKEHPVQAWRVIDVEDEVCNAVGACNLVTTRMLARWVPALRSYAFGDRVGRVWIVE